MNLIRLPFTKPCFGQQSVRLKMGLLHMGKNNEGICRLFWFTLEKQN